MDKKCFTCEHGYRHFNGMSYCSIEPSDGNCHHDDYCCPHYDPISDKAYKERLSYKIKEHKDELVKRLVKAKQIILITTGKDGAIIDWDTKSIKDAIDLLEKGLQYLRNKQCLKVKKDK